MEPVLVGIFLGVMALLGAPLFAVIGALALLSFSAEGIDPSVVMIDLTRIATNPTLLAIPLFTFAGYILAEMDLDDTVWYMVKNTPGVTGFVGPGRQAVPVPQEEVDSIRQKMMETGDKPRPKISFETGSKVRIVEGPFQNFTGYISNIDSERGRLKIMVDILGRSTPVELDFLQVEKV